MILKNKIKKIIDAIKDTEISEIEISSFWGIQKIKLKKGTDYNTNLNESTSFSNEKLSTKNDLNVNLHEQTDTSSHPTLNEDENLAVEASHQLTIIRAPLVGTFFLSPKPGEPPFIENNSKINKGDTLCIVEAMKIFNEIESEYSGIIREILVSDGEPVEFDQPLFKIEES